MNLLYVSYYFPPMGLSGVTRTLKFVKYLSVLGWNVRVLTGSPVRYYAFDESLIEEIPPGVRVIRTGSLDAFHLRRGKQTVRSALPPSGGRAVSRFFFIPDSKIGWYPFAVSKWSAECTGTKPDAVLATAPPWTSFLVGNTIAQHWGSPLVLDYRDSWLMDAQSPQPTSFHRWAASRLEARVVNNSRAVIAVNELLRNEIATRYRANAPNTNTIYNGFDPEDFQNLPCVESPFVRGGDKNLRLFYMGTLYQDVNRPRNLFQALVILKQRWSDGRLPLEIVCMGIVDKSYFRLTREMGVDDLVRFVPYRTHREALASLKTADAALLLIDPHPYADRHVPGKLFEYFGAQLPVLALAPEETEAARIITECGAGLVLPADDPAAISEGLAGWIERKFRGRGLPLIDTSRLSPFDRKQQAEQLDVILREL